MRRPQIRRVFRFSLASFLLAITIFCVWLGIQVNRVRRQESAVAWVEEAGGRVAYGYQRDKKGDWTGHWDKGGNWVWDAEPHGPKWLRELIGDEYSLTVVEVDLRGTKATDLSPLTDLPDVEWLFAQYKHHRYLAAGPPSQPALPGSHGCSSHGYFAIAGVQHVGVVGHQQHTGA